MSRSEPRSHSSTRGAAAPFPIRPAPVLDAMSRQRNRHLLLALVLLASLLIAVRPRVASAAPHSLVEVLGAHGNWTLTESRLQPSGTGQPDVLVLRGNAGGPGPLDLVLRFHGMFDMVPAVVVIDEELSNRSGRGWPSFHMLLGTGVGDDFVASSDYDGLYFKDRMVPRALAGAWAGVPEQDDMIAPDRLSWAGPPGLAAGQAVRYWVPISGLDRSDGVVDDAVTFTLRQVATPEPAGLVLVACGALGLLPWLLLRRRT